MNCNGHGAAAADFRSTPGCSSLDWGGGYAKTKTCDNKLAAGNKS